MSEELTVEQLITALQRCSKNKISNCRLCILYGNRKCGEVLVAQAAAELDYLQRRLKQTGKEKDFYRMLESDCKKQLAAVRHENDCMDKELQFRNQLLNNLTCEGHTSFCTQQQNESLTLCKEDENFIQNKFGYCFYTLDSQPLIYNLYVHPEYRHQGHSRELLELVISEVQRSGYEGKIRIQAKPRENSIQLATLIRYYKSMGFIVCNAHQPETGETQ